MIGTSPEAGAKPRLDLLGGLPLSSARSSATGPAANAMVPPIAAARAKKSGRLGAAFGPRFFLFLLLGLVWLGPAWWDARFLAGMLLWDALGIIFLAADLAALPRVEQIEVSRIWSSAPSLSVPARVAIEVRQQGKATIRAELADDVPASLCEKPPLLILRCAPGRPVRAAYDILPVERGDLRLGRISLRVQSPLGLAERWLVADVAQTVRVFPDLAEARRHTLYLMKSRQVELEKRRTRLRGYGREFESLREYREGDELRDICWTASARRGAPVTKTYEIERSQAVWLVVDAGRLLRARVGVPGLRAPLEKLDFSTSAALALAFVALYSGDRVGLVAYGRRVQQRLNAARGSGQQRALADALAQVRSEPWEGDHGLACDTLLRHQKRRSLVVWLTDLAETAAMPDVIESTMRLVRRHLVLFVVLGQPDLAQLAATTPRSPTEMYRSMAAQEMVQRRDLLLRDLHEQGAQTLQVDPQRLVPALLDAYLGIKERSLL